MKEYEEKLKNLAKKVDKWHAECDRQHADAKRLRAERDSCKYFMAV